MLSQFSIICSPKYHLKCNLCYWPIPIVPSTQSQEKPFDSETEKWTNSCILCSKCKSLYLKNQMKKLCMLNGVREIQSGKGKVNQVPRPWSLHQFSSVQSLSRVRLFETPWIATCQASLSITNSRSSLRLTSIESVMPSSRLILGRPLLLMSPIPPSIRVFSNESTLHMRWPNYWSFSFSTSPSKEHPGLISFRMDWLDLLAVRGTLKSLLQHHSSKASILRRSAFFTVQLSHPYMTIGKKHSLD